MKIVLLIEDKAEEMEKAKAILAKNGLRFVSAGNLADAFRIWEKLGDKISAVLTDLNFPERENSPESASGFAIVMRTARLNVPCSICTDVDHHFCGFLKFFLDDLSRVTGKHIPFTMDSKDWELAVRKLVKQLEKEE